MLKRMKKYIEIFNIYNIMNKFLYFLLSFSILNSSFAGELLCPYCYNNYFANYSDGKTFATEGLDVYIVDDFTNNENFDKYYKLFFGEKEEFNFLPIEEYNINTFTRKEDPSNELHFSSHENPWYYHLYKKKENDNESQDYNENLITTLAKKMSTKGGNNFDWEEGRDKARWFNSFRSKVRHNKNVIIIKLNNAKDELFKKTISIFRKFVNMSYCPFPIIFIGDFEYKTFEEHLEQINKDITNNYDDNKKNEPVERGKVDPLQEISNYQCFYIQQNYHFVNNVKEKLNFAANYHNSKNIKFDGETFNITVVGLPRSGKTTLANIILNNFLAKASNDVTSVTRKKTKYFHSNVKNIPIAVIDTPGFEDNEDSVNNFIKWLDAENEDDKSKKNFETIHLFIYVINVKNFPEPEDFKLPLYSKSELKLIKKIKEKEIPIVFVIARSESIENGYKYLRKWFGDLALNNELSNFKSKDENWKAEDQWICPKWTRGTLIQLKNDPIKNSEKYTGKYGLVKLMNIINELFKDNKKYKNRIPEIFANKHSLYYILNELKLQFRKKGFNDDTCQEPISNCYQYDHILYEVDNVIPSCLDIIKDIYHNKQGTCDAGLWMYEKNWGITFNPLQQIINAFAQGKKEIKITILSVEYTIPLDFL